MNNRRKLLVALGASALAVTALMGYLVWSGYQEAIRAAETTTRNYAAIIEARLDATLRRADADLQELARTIPVAALSQQAVPRYAREINATLDSHLNSFPELAGVRILDANGDRLYTSASVSTPQSNRADRDYFRLLRDDPEAGLVFSEVVISRSRGQPSIAAARALRDGQGAFRGIVFATIELDHFQKMFQSLDLGAKGALSIYRSDDFTLVARWPQVDGALNTPLPESSPTRAALAQGNKTATAEYSARSDGLVRIYSLNALDRYPFVVTASLAREDVLAGWKERALAVGMLGLLLVGLLTGLLYRLSRAEASLKANEELMRTTFEQAAVGIVHTSLDRRYLLVNQKFCDLLGYSRDELLAMRSSDITHPDDLLDESTYRKQLLAGALNVYSAEKRYVCKNGTVIWVNRTVSLARDGAGKPLYFIRMIEDISKRKEAEDRFLATFEQAAVGIAHIAVDNFHILLVNRKFCDLLGYTQDELIGTDSRTWTPPDHMPVREAERAQILAGTIETSTCERQLFRKDGSLLWVSRSLSLVRDPAGQPQYFISVIEDISERKRTEQAARRQNELTQLLEALARAANEAQTPEEALQALLKLICAHGRWPVGHVVTFAPDRHARAPESSLWQLEDRERFADIVEHTERYDYTGRKGRFLDIILNQKKPAWVEDLWTVPVGPRGAALVAKGVHAEFGFPVVVGGEVLALLEFFALEPRPADTLLLANLTNVGAQLARVIERERALNALREREHLMRLVTEGVPAMLAYFDAELKCRFANAAYCEFRHLDPQGVIGKSLLEITGDDTYRVIRPSIDLVKQGKPVMQRRNERTATGEIRHIEVHRVPDMSAEGEFRGYYVMVLDITEQVRAEEAHNQLEAHLHEAQKMEAVGTLAGGIAHDFNNILGAIIGNAALARGDIGAGHPALVSLDEIYKASQRAKDMVRQILAFSRKQPQQLLIQPLRPMVEDSVKLLRATLPASVELVATISDIPLYVHADATQIQQVLLNLCTNAWHAMEGQPGHIEIGLDAVQLDAAAVSTLSGLQPGRHARLSVSDNGKGIDAVTQARIFEPFFTTKPVGQGTGLGLSVVHGIIKAHRGVISLESALGAGATFQIYFPAVTERRAEARPEPAAPGSARGTGQHVLYVDDDEAMVFLVTRMLEGLGYRVSGYECAEEALEAVRADAGNFDLVVTDFNMPRLSGIQVAQEIARARPGLPVVITSGYITEELRTNALQAGVRRLLYKPDTVNELCQVIQQLLETATA